MDNTFLKRLVSLLFFKYIACDTSEDADVAKLYSIESQIDRLKSLISAQDATIARQFTNIANLRADIAEQNTKIAQQDATIAGQTTKIAQQETTIAEQNTKIAQQETTINNLRINVVELNAKIANQNAFVDLPQNWDTVLQKLNETQIQQENKITEMETLLKETIDGKDRAMDRMNKTLDAYEKDLIYNVAVGKSTQQSSTHEHADSGRAVDNNWNGDYFDGSCSHTRKDAQPWWKVDLVTTHGIYVVTIKNRADGSWDRIIGAQVLVGDEPHYKQCGTFTGPTFAGEVRRLSCSTPLRGRYVKIQLPRANFLQLCEVAVSGYPISD